MHTSTRKVIYLVCALTVVSLFMNCGGCGGDDEGGSGEGVTVTLSGEVAVSSQDAVAARSPSPDSSILKTAVRPRFKTQADTPLSGATVTLFKMLVDGTEEEVDIGTVTTDTSGSYTIEDVPAAAGGTGEATDFYYEIRVTSGDLTILAPTAPEADTTVNVSPETHLAAKMLTDVQNIEGSVLPRPETIENLREMTADEVGEDLSGKVALPLLSAGEGVTVIAATAIASSGGNAEKGFKTFESEKEVLVLDTAGTAADSAEVGSYLERVGRLGCDFNTNFNFPETIREAMAEAFINDNTNTSTEVIEAYNANNGGDPEAGVDATVSEFDTMLDNIDNAIAGGEPIESGDQVALFVRRDLTGDTFDATTALDVDQSMALVQQLLPTQCQPGAFDFIGFVSDLTGSDVVAAPSIVDKQIYNDAMGGSCSDGSGHVTSEVQVYAAGGATVNGATLSRGGTTKSLARQSENGPFSRWRRFVQQGDADFNAAVDCVALPTDAEYTISVDLGGAGADFNETVTVNHRSVPEASIKWVSSDDGAATSMTDSQVTYPVDSKRPIFEWSPPPGTPDAAVIANAPAESKIKFTFELSHVFTSNFLNTLLPKVVNQGPLSQCSVGGSNQRLMDRAYFISDSDCDPAACLATLQTNPILTFTAEDTSIVTVDTSTLTTADIACRTNTATFLVDGNDRYLGVGAGNFRFYCVDSNGDGNCGG